MMGMTFHDLPPNVRDLPLTDTVLASDVIDLLIGERDRRTGCLAVMLCDDEARGLQPVVVNDVPEGTDAATLRQVLDIVLPMAAEQGGSALVGRGRREGIGPTDEDRLWHQQAIDSCAEHG